MDHGPITAPPAGKRKRARKQLADSDDDGGGGPLDLSKPASNVAKQILRSLEGCDESSKEAKTLKAAFSLVQRELGARAAERGRAAERAGARAPLVFSGVSVPEVCFQHIVEFVQARLPTLSDDERERYRNAVHHAGFMRNALAHSPEPSAAECVQGVDAVQFEHRVQ